MWHDNIGVENLDGTGHEVFPTRALFTGEGALGELADFTAGQHLQAVAAHELGHFLVNWKLGAWMTRISVQEDPGNVIPKGVVSFVHPDGEESRPVLIGGAAGERAADRWLHEQGLWTPARAVYGELQGSNDRQAARTADPSITFDGGPNDYRHLQDEADRILDETWPLLVRGLKHFHDFAAYTGDEMCGLLGIPNNLPA
jgi:hypothetical protein